MTSLGYGAGSDVGRVRTHNEDSYVVEPELGLWLVADGMGGHEGGEVASAIACATVTQAVRQGTPLVDAIKLAHEEIITASQEENGAKGMGATVVALRSLGMHYEIAWVGDSRAYLWDGTLYQLSHDHSYVQKLIDEGELSETEAKNHPQSNIVTQALGALGRSRMRVGYITGQWIKNQQILLCSDGLNNELSDEEINHVLASTASEQVLVDRLVDAALSNGGRDNVSVILISAPVDAPPALTMEATSPLPSAADTSSSTPPFLPPTWLISIGVGIFCALLIGMAYYIIRLGT